MLTLFQRHPEDGRYFVAIFCRYSPVVYTLIWHSAKSPVQADYLFALTWRHIYYELGGFDVRANSVASGEHMTLQNWLINITALCINRSSLPPVEEIHYSLQETSPPLWCYVEQALDQLDPTLRLMVLMAQTYRWSDIRIAAYLQAEGEKIAAEDVKAKLKEGYTQLEEVLPDDIRAIYCEQKLNIGRTMLEHSGLVGQL